MERILDSLEIDWEKINHPHEEIRASVIYLAKYIKFCLIKIRADDLMAVEGDVYRIIIYEHLTFHHMFLLNKLACAGLRFVFRSLVEYRINPEETQRRHLNEARPAFEVNEEFEHNPEGFEDAMFESIEDAYNNFNDGWVGYDPSEELIETSLYIRFHPSITEEHFATGNRWVNIGMEALKIAEQNQSKPLSAIAIYSLFEIISRVGSTADIGFIAKAKEVASLETNNALLRRWNGRLLNKINSFNRIFYEI